MPAHERGWSTDDLRRFDRLKAKLARIDLKPKQRAQAEEELENLLRAPREREDRAYRDRAIAETVQLAESRGEFVEKRKGVTQIRDRDSLKALHDGGHLDDGLYEAGKWCRKLYDGRMEGVGSQLGALTGPGGAHDNNKFVGRRFLQAKASAPILMVERDIVKAASRFQGIGFSAHFGITLLRAVCQEDKALSWFGSGDVFKRHLAVLRLALEEAAERMSGRRDDEA